MSQAPNPSRPSSVPETYWEKAGEVSYAEAMFHSLEVERHINQRKWDLATDVGFRLGLKPESRILDLGCGDGAFANAQLSRFFTHVDGYDLSVAAIQRANAMRACESFQFHAADITAMDYRGLHCDGAYLMGILHHIKPQAAQVVQRLRDVAPRIVVLEPNGAHPVRKLLELTPGYRRAGEKSFTATAVVNLFTAAGFELKEFHRIGLFPNFTPDAVLSFFKPLESFIEASRYLSLSCTASIFGFVRK